ncbi:MAG: hypothetical protein GY950_04765 [bacterium]|nr:hypothetical protein [bacterium]
MKIEPSAAQSRTLFTGIVLVFLLFVFNFQGQAQILVPAPEGELKVFNGDVWFYSYINPWRARGKTFQRIPDVYVDIRNYGQRHRGVRYFSKFVNIDNTTWLATDIGAYRVSENSYKRIPDVPVGVKEILKIGNDTWIRAYQGTWRVRGDTAKRIPDREVSGVDSIKKVNGNIWIINSSGAWRVEGERAIMHVPGSGNSLEKIGQDVWIYSWEGAWRFRGDSIQRIPDLKLSVNEIREIDKKVWICTEQGLWLAAGNGAARIANLEESVSRIRKFGDQIFVHTMQSLWLLRENNVKRILYAPDFSKLQFNNIGETVYINNGSELWRVKGNSIVRILKKEAGESQDEYISSSQKIDGYLWVETTKGLYRIKNDSSRRIPGNQNVSIESIAKIGGYIWMMTDVGAWRIQGDAVKRFPDQKINVWQVEKIDGQFWMMADTGAWRIQGNTAVRMPDMEIDVEDIEKIGDHIWVTADMGVWRIRGNIAKRIPDMEINVADIEKIGDHTWVTADMGVWRIADDSAWQVFKGNVKINSIDKVGNDIWVATDTGAWRIRGNIAKRMPDMEIDVEDIEKIGDHIWVTADTGAWRITGDSAWRVFKRNVEINNIAEIGNGILLSTEKGLWHVKGNSVKLFFERLFEEREERENASPLPDWAGDLTKWIRMRSFGRDLVRDNKKVEFSSGITKIGKNIWVSFYKENWRLDENVHLVVDLKGEGGWWEKLLNAFIPGKVWLSGTIVPRPGYVDSVTGLDPYEATSPREPRYVKSSTGIDPYNLSSPRDFEIIMETDPAAFKRKKEKRQYSWADGYEKNVSSGKHTLYVKVRDQWGNLVEFPPMEIWVVPGALVFAVIVPVLWILFLFMILFLSPVSRFSHDLIMNPNLRNYGSFGMIPLIVTIFPPLRRYLLRRYINQLRQETDFALWLERFIVPADHFQPDRFEKRLKEKRKLYYFGRSGIGKTSYFKYLVALGVSKTRGEILKGVIPVFLPLSRYEGEAPEKIFYSQLESYGRIFDENLSQWFLRQGGFIIFIDGLNEVPEKTRKMVNRFVDEYKHSSYFCLNSQEVYPEFSWLEAVEVSPLSREKINKIVKLRLGEEQAAQEIEKFDGTTYKLCQIPHNLDLVLQLLEEKEPLPKTETELYSKLIDRILTRWKREEKDQYEEFLYHRAFRMIRTGDLVFNNTDSNIHLPEEVTDRLSEKKSRLLVKRGSLYYFSHDLIRAFLASRYAGPRWRDILSDDEIGVDSSWRVMLEFIIADQETGEGTRKLLFSVLEKNKPLARALFEWLEIHYPERCESWLKEFKVKSW